MELRDSKKWSNANLFILGSLAFCAALSQIPKSLAATLSLTYNTAETLVAIIAAIPLFIAMRKFSLAVEQYEPSTALEAKRANEQIKLTANFTNAAANTSAGVIAVGQLVKDSQPNSGLIIFGIVIAALMHVTGRNIVSNLKDEATK